MTSEQLKKGQDLRDKLKQLEHFLTSLEIAGDDDKYSKGVMFDADSLHNHISGSMNLDDKPTMKRFVKFVEEEISITKKEFEKL